MQIVRKPEKPKSREPLILLGLRLVIQVLFPLGSSGNPVQVQVLSPVPYWVFIRDLTCEYSIFYFHIKVYNPLWHFQLYCKVVKWDFLLNYCKESNNCDILIMPNKLNKQKQGDILSFYRENYTLIWPYWILNLVKTQIPLNHYGLDCYPHSV